MALYISDRYIWDFWMAQNGTDYHVFYLQAPRSLKDPDQRHWNVSIGHAVSKDLSDWQILPDTLTPGPAGAWDDYTTWTGSILSHKGLWYFFYTGTNHAEKGLIQRIGLATSTDLTHWEKNSANPLIVADPRWYEELDLKLWHDQAWRDPWVFQHPQTGDFHALITARVNYGPTAGRGVIGHARSANLLNWEVLPPVTEPGNFGQMEVPQLVGLAGNFYLLFCGVNYSQTLVKPGGGLINTEPVIGTHYLVANNPLGPFQFTRDEFLAGDKFGSLYAGKLIKGPDGEWKFMAWYNQNSQGEFIGALSDPLPVQLDATGNLSVKYSLPQIHDQFTLAISKSNAH